MNRFKLTLLNKEPEIKIISGKKEFDFELLKEIDLIWEKELQDKETLLYNGTILSLVDLKEGGILLQTTEYKHFVAQLRNPALIPKINILPFGVTGITTSGNTYLVGKRSQRVSMNKGFYEFAPAGSLEIESSMQKQVLKELEEEVGVGENEVIKISAYAIIQDLEQQYAEICFKITLKQDALKKTESATEEYSSILWLDKEGLKNHFQKHKELYVPISSYLIQNMICIQ